MDPLEKLELIYRGIQAKKKAELERCKEKPHNSYGHSTLYLLGLQHEIDMLSVVLDDLKAVRENHRSVRDELVKKMYGPR